MSKSTNLATDRLVFKSIPFVIWVMLAVLCLGCAHTSTIRYFKAGDEIVVERGSVNTRVPISAFRRRMKGAYRVAGAFTEKMRMRIRDYGKRQPLDSEELKKALVRIADFAAGTGPLEETQDAEKINQTVDRVVDRVIDQPALDRIVHAKGEHGYQFNILNSYISAPAFVADFVVVKAGTFLMGSPPTETGHSPDERQHEVKISRDFEIQATSVTQSQFFLVMGYNPSSFKTRDICPREHVEVNGVGLCGSHPVENVSWDDTQDFIEQLNTLDKKYAYRLPTEAEREYAGRAGATGPYWFGSDARRLDDYAWRYSNSDSKTHPVGSKPANPWGLFDAHGNIWNWVSDWYGEYPKEAQTDPKGPATGTLRVFRGGSWGSTTVYGLRAAARRTGAPSFRGYNVGFRLVREPK